MFFINFSKDINKIVLILVRIKQADKDELDEAEKPITRKSAGDCSFRFDWYIRIRPSEREAF